MNYTGDAGHFPEETVSSIRWNSEREGYCCCRYWKLGETFAALILTLWLVPDKHFIGWIELDPQSTAARNPRLRDSWLKKNIMENEQKP
jgi:hypothetical protein